MSAQSAVQALGLFGVGRGSSCGHRAYQVAPEASEELALFGDLFLDQSDLFALEPKLASICENWEAYGIELKHLDGCSSSVAHYVHMTVMVDYWDAYAY
ncbi:hypothetical protein BJV74DRAFT_883476 [Russula compacta]|nr:hypothetical protein BJV74DRAFT_883476 [Russula compacta]